MSLRQEMYYGAEEVKGLFKKEQKCASFLLFVCLLFCLFGFFCLVGGDLSEEKSEGN